jgi:hypothetical protein
MKGAMNVRLIVGIFLLAFGGARALPAAEVIGDGQEQARLLLSGRGDSPGSPKSGFVSPSTTAAKSIALDAQAKAREMILGRQIAKKPIIEADGLRAVGGARNRKVGGDPHEMAQRMILGSQSAGSLARIRLTSKTE